MKKLPLLVMVLALGACDSSEQQAGIKPPESQQATVADSTDSSACANRDENGMALFGDVHVHTSYSFDAAANSTGATPYDAHRYARGEAIPFFPINDQGEATGTVRIDRPLDFLAVTDHGEFLGERAICRTATSPVYETEFCTKYRSDERLGMEMLSMVIITETPTRIEEICGPGGELCRDFAKSPWEDIQDAANSANDPCNFTSFIGYEYTGTPGTSNYHRNVIFRGDKVPALPVSYIDAPIDSKLWAELDAVCNVGNDCDYLTIPHNSNLANGRMAPYMKLEDTLAAKQSYARARLSREPIMEIFQHKGGSECINGLGSILGAPDELCHIESVRRMGEERTYDTRTGDPANLHRGQAVAVTTECEPGVVGENGMVGAGCVHATDFQRSALLIGLQEEQAIGLNPIKLGIIAATDTHTATPGAVVESDWSGAVTGEATPAQRLQPGLLTSGIEGNPGGLAGVWAKENTRDAIFDAMLRREVFGTSGPRISVRFFAGWAFEPGLCDSRDPISLAYDQGVPMGSDLIATDKGKPVFLAMANKDPTGRGLNELHLIKGWVDGQGGLHNEVIPIAQDESGAGTLCAVYRDEDFDPAQPAYYYLRAVEPATPRWHTYDCAAMPEEERPAVCTDGSYPEMIREMAWSSPIWYRPE